MLTQSTWGGLAGGAAGSGPLPSIPSGYIFDESQEGDIPITAADRMAGTNASGRPVDATCTNWDELEQISRFLDSNNMTLDSIDLTDLMSMCEITEETPPAATATAATTATATARPTSTQPKSRSGVLQPTTMPEGGSPLMTSRSGTLPVLERSTSGSSSASDLSQGDGSLLLKAKISQVASKLSMSPATVKALLAKRRAALEVGDTRSAKSNDSPARSIDASPARSDTSDGSDGGGAKKKATVVQSLAERRKKLDRRSCAFR